MTTNQILILVAALLVGMLIGALLWAGISFAKFAYEFLSGIWGVKKKPETDPDLDSSCGE